MPTAFGNPNAKLRTRRRSDGEVGWGGVRSDGEGPASLVTGTVITGCDVLVPAFAVRGAVITGCNVSWACL